MYKGAPFRSTAAACHFQEAVRPSIRWAVSEQQPCSRRRSEKEQGRGTGSTRSTQRRLIGGKQGTIRRLLRRRANERRYLQVAKLCPVLFCKALRSSGGEVFAKITRNDLHFCSGEDGSEIVKLKTDSLTKNTPGGLRAREFTSCGQIQEKKIRWKVWRSCLVYFIRVRHDFFMISAFFSAVGRKTGHGLRTPHSGKTHWRIWCHSSRSGKVVNEVHQPLRQSDGSHRVKFGQRLFTAHPHVAQYILFETRTGDEKDDNNSLRRFGVLHLLQREE